MSDNDRGLYKKFIIQRMDNTDRPGRKHDGCRYFVLDLDHDPNAFAALLAYATECEADNPILASDLRRMTMEPNEAVRERYKSKIGP